MTDVLPVLPDVVIDAGVDNARWVGSMQTGRQLIALMVQQLMLEEYLAHTVKLQQLHDYYSTTS